MPDNNDNRMNLDRLALLASFLSLISSIIFFILAIQVARQDDIMIIEDSEN